MYDHLNVMYLNFVKRSSNKYPLPGSPSKCSSSMTTAPRLSKFPSSIKRLINEFAFSIVAIATCTAAKPPAGAEPPIKPSILTPLSDNKS